MRRFGRQLAVEGASAQVCVQLGIPEAWAERCEDWHHVGHDSTVDVPGYASEKLLGEGRVLTNF